ncbi:MAG: ATP-binding protein [Cytophagaceae bacterium]|nr:ATP-binding protein [Cytophagaceae bacterium]
MPDSLKVPCSIDNLKDIRSFITKRLQELSVPELEINMMILAVDEICANVIIHASHSTNQSLEITVKEETDGISFEISNEGNAFDINAYQAPGLEDIVKNKRKGGLGLILVKKIMDKIEFRKENNHTVCRLFKKVSFVNHSA